MRERDHRRQEPLALPADDEARLRSVRADRYSSLVGGFATRSGAALLCAAVALGGSALAGPLPPDQVPEPLAPWVDWVLRDAPDFPCVFVHGSRDHRQCVWPARLQLELDERGGRFVQEWRVERESWVPLPGDADSWPEAVRRGDRPAAVVAQGGHPVVRLQAGPHRLRGRFRWSQVPEFLQVPPETGLVSLTLNGTRIAFPERDLRGRLWLQRRAEDRAVESRLEVSVHRRVIDEVPLQIETQIELRVAGESREVLIGPALPEWLTLLSLTSPLPARLDADGRLRVQVRPGSWRLRFLARHERGPVHELALPTRPEDADPWDEQEVWVFDARNHLRLVQVGGVPGIDPGQTTLPNEWRALPAYLMTPGSVMRLEQKRRGDEDPAPDRLSLRRTWWLDFDGGGYTVHDEISGALSKSWRLETGAPTVLGRVAIDGRDQFIGQLEGAERAGVELRQGAVRIDADSRVEGVRGRIPTVGWSQDFQQVSAQLNLPPGWRLFHASGVDDVQTTWTTRWTLLEIFLVLVTAAIVAQLWGLLWGGVALVTLALLYPEVDAPRWSWLVLLAVQALVRVLPEGGFLRAARLARLGAIALLALIAIPFAVGQVRLALYPALEFPSLSVRGQAAKAAGVARAVMEAEPPAARDEDSLMQEGVFARGRLPSAPESLTMGLARSALPQRYYAPDPTALVSTGPGLPHWGWRAVELGWRGPVLRDEQIRLVLIPPWANSALAWLRVGLLALLFIAVLGQGERLRGLLTSRGSAAALLALGFAGPLAPSAAAADIPSPELLDELQKRLLEPVECFPDCASSSLMELDVSAARLRATLTIDVAARTAVPLPGALEHWRPQVVQVDGSAPSLARGPDGTLWIPLRAGTHQVTVEGPLPERDSVQIPLPLKPHRLTATVSGWVLDGLGEDGEVADSLQLTRQRAEPGPGDGIEPQEIAPFARVERMVRLGLTWDIETRVVRVSPTGRALFLEVPLLPGESVTSEAVRVADGIAQVTLPPEIRTLAWRSLLDPTERLLLDAPQTSSWTEVWQLDATPIWHVEPAGIPVVHSATPAPIRIRQWRPWPGERVEIGIERPGSVPGRTLTLDRTALEVRPGLRATDLTLTLSVRTSRGVQHAVTLPAGAELQRASLDGALQPLQIVDGRVTIPIPPGKHLAELEWRSRESLSTRYRTPVVAAGAPSVNSELELRVPRDRWVLLVGGPRLGPAVLFWTLLTVALLLALALGRIRLTPLGSASWFLLFVGMSQIPVWAAAIVVAWLFALGWRREHLGDAGPVAFDAAQIGLSLWTLVALGMLVWAVQQGLLGLPDMQISGNGSRGGLLRWYHDRSSDELPRAWVVSVPLLVYRLAMLAWALWLARALLRWLRWAWQSFSTDGLWRALPRRRPRRGPPIAPAPGGAAPESSEQSPSG